MIDTTMRNTIKEKINDVTVLKNLNLQRKQKESRKAASVRNGSIHA